MVTLPYKLILGSQSPRRSELLIKAGLDFEKRVIETDESYPADLAIEKIAEHIAIAKADAHKPSIARDELVLTADTIVVLDGKVYGKPKDSTEAVDTICLLSEKVHLVYTGVCMMSRDKQQSFSEMSEVKFGSISKAEAEAYVEQFEPMDKAGAYGIQDWVGFARIEWIKGSYTNILGLPLAQVYNALKGLSL